MVSRDDNYDSTGVVVNDDDVDVVYDDDFNADNWLICCQKWNALWWWA